MTYITTVLHLVLIRSHSLLIFQYYHTVCTWVSFAWDHSACLIYIFLLHYNHEGHANEWGGRRPACIPLKPPKTEILKSQTL